MSESGMEESRLIAFVDGELPAGEVREVEAMLERDAGLRERVERLRALRILARDEIREKTPRASEALRMRIVEMVREEERSRSGGVAADGGGGRKEVEAGAGERRGVSWRLGARWAVAACLAVAGGAGVWLVVGGGWVGERGRSVVVGREVSGLTVEKVLLLESRHLKCVMMGNNFMDPAFPKVLEDVGPSVRAFLGGDVATPDLSGIGLTFAGVGPCDMPGGKTLHWLYRKDVGGVAVANVSLFVQPYSGQVSVGRDQVVVVSGPTEKFPLLVWRSESFVYFLIGDDFGATDASARRMGVSFGG